MSPDESGTDLEEPTTELPTQSPTKSPTQSPHPKNTNDLIDRDVIDRGDIKPPSIIISRDEIPDDHWEIDAPDNIQTKGKRAFSFLYRTKVFEIWILKILSTPVIQYILLYYMLYLSNLTLQT